MDSEFEQTGRPTTTGRGMAQSIVATLSGTLRRRWRMLLIVFAILLVAGETFVAMLPPEYTGVARVRIEPSRAAVLGDLTANRPDQGAIDTEASVIRSREIVSEAVRRLALDREPALIEGLPPVGTSPQDNAKRIEQVTNRILPKLSVGREGLTYIVNVRFESGDPKLAAKVATGVARTYISYNQDRRLASLTREARFVEEQRSKAETDAREADEQLARYRASAGIVKSGDATIADQQINPLAVEVATAESQATAARAKLSAAERQIARGGIDAVSAVLDSPVIGSLRAQRSVLAEKQGEISTRYGEKHPDTVKIKQQISAIDGQIESEANRVKGGLESEAVAADARAASLRRDLQRLEQEQVSDARKGAAEEGYVRQADAANARYTALVEQQRTQAANQTTVPQAAIVDEAQVPSQPSSPNRPLLFAAVALLSLLSGAAVISTQEMLSTGIRSIADIERLGIPVLATIPNLDAREGGSNAAETIIVRPMSGFAEAYRVVRRSLLADTPPPAVLALVSALPGEGKTSSALALGRIMALAEERVLIIDTDLRRGKLIGESGSEAKAGLVQVLRGEVSAEEAIIADRIERCYLLPAIGETFLAEDLIGGWAMRALVERLRGSFDRIIFDTAPLLGVADARAVAAMSDAVILMVKWGDTPKKAVENALNWLEMDGTRVNGAVLTMVSSASDAETGLYHSKRYGDYYQS